MSSKSVRPSRNVDAESGKNRVSRNKPAKKQAQWESESEEEYVLSDLEQELEMPAKTDSVRPRKQKSKKRAPPPRTASHGVEGEEESGEELAQTKANETSSKVAPHMMILLSATYHLGFDSIVRPAISNYIPSCNNMFVMAIAMMNLVSENTYLQEMYPGFFSVGFYCYVGYLYFYQVLRAKDEVGNNQLSRSERRALRALRSTGEPEQWPVPAPLIEFVRALGYYKSSNSVFSYVVPSFPNFAHVSRPAGNNAQHGFQNYSAVGGIQRVPPVCAYMEFLRQFGIRHAAYNVDQGWIPSDQVALAAGHQFMGIADSTAATGANFQSLVFSDGWNEPTEGEMRWGPVQAATKRQTIRRWNVPTRSNVNIDSIEVFLGVEEGVSTSWIQHLIAMSSVVCRFFPGSTTLSAIDPVCHLGTLINIKADMITNVARVPVDNHWYPSRTGWCFSYRAYDDTEQGRILNRIGLATGTNTHFTANVLPVGTRNNGRDGPFFEDDANNGDTERHEVFKCEGYTETDPAGRFEEQVSAVYDPTGGRK